jgi:phage gpG-like protein
MSRVVVRFNRIPAAKRDISAQASALIRALAFETERTIKQSFGTSPSPVGGPPGVDTGALRASIHVEMTDALTALVSDGVEYGAHLEFGTTRMGARPFMMPGLLWAAQNVARIARGMKWGA